MSVRSMTGYGRGEAAAGGIKAIVELGAVNHKQFDVRLDLPRGLDYAEARVTALIHERVARGSLTCRVALDVSPARLERTVRVNAPLARAYVARLRGVGRTLAVRDDLGLSHLLALPDVVQPASPTADPGRLLPLIVRALRGALKALCAMRADEGRALERDLRTRLRALPRSLDRIAARAPEVTARYRRVLQQRVRASGLTLDLDDPRFLREVALFADRADIAEEIVRLRSHFGQAEKMLVADEPVGRSLDFLAQEMAREINTIGSKANDAAIAAEVVRFKTELERLREQAQNIE